MQIIDMNNKGQVDYLPFIKRQIKWVMEKSEYYRTLLQELNISYSSVESIDDFQNIPLLDIDEVIKKYGAKTPYFLLTLPISALFKASLINIGEYKLLQFTTQREFGCAIETVLGVIDEVGINRAGTVALCGKTSDSRLMTFSYAVEHIGALSAVIDPAEIRASQFIMDNMLPDTMIISDEYWKWFYQNIVEEGIHTSRNIIFILNELEAADKIARKCAACDSNITYIYMPSLLFGNVVAYRKYNEDFFRLNAENFFAEIINPRGNENGTSEASGELVLTTLNAEAMPLIRWLVGANVILRKYDDNPLNIH